MKTISLLAVLAVLAAISVLPVSFAAGSSLVFLVGFACITVTDYARRSPSLYRADNSMVSLARPLRSLRPTLELAA